MPAFANKTVKNLRGVGKVDNKSLAAGALTARTNQSTDSADNGVNLEVFVTQQRSSNSLTKCRASVALYQLDLPCRGH